MAHVTAFFTERFSAHAAVEQLVQAGFPRDDISVVMSESTHGREFASSPRLSNAVGGGGVLDAIVSGLASVDTLVVPGTGLFAAGPLLGSLVGGDDGSLVGALVELGIPEIEARFVSERIRGGGILLDVLTPPGGRAELATQVLRLSGGESLEAAA